MRVVSTLLLCKVLLCLSNGCIDQPDDVTPPPPSVGFERLGAAAMERFKSNYSDVASEMADAIEAGEITKASEEHDALSEANKRARDDAFSEINAARDDMLSEEWDAESSARMFRELSRGYRR